MSNWISHFTLGDVDFYVVAIVLLLPITAGLLVFQTNPYQALVIRGILGAIAALVYVLFGAADVALTEALVGTMLSITLYAVAVRSSMSMRLGVLAPLTPSVRGDELEVELSSPIPDPQHRSSLDPQLLQALRTCLKPHHLRLEIVPYDCLEALERSLQSKDVQIICIPNPQIPNTSIPNTQIPNPPDPTLTPVEAPIYHLQTRLRRLQEILQPIPPTIATVSYQQLKPLDNPKLLPIPPLPDTAEV